MKYASSSSRFSVLPSFDWRGLLNAFQVTQPKTVFSQRNPDEMRKEVDAGLDFKQFCDTSRGFLSKVTFVDK